MKICIKAMGLVFVAATVLAACGGGGGGVDAGATLTPSVLGGVAAVGSPIVSGIINISCADGPTINSTTTNSSGAWQSTLSGQTLPCAVQVTGGTINGIANAIQYHSIATDIGVVNVTPLTDLLVANIIGSATPNLWFSSLKVTSASLVNIKEINVIAALTKLRSAMSVLTSLSTINPITTTFTPVTGNVSDDMLSALKTALVISNLTHTSLLSNASDTVFVSPPSNFSTALASAYAALSSNEKVNTVGGPGISGVIPSSADIGQQVMISGSNFAKVAGSLLSGGAYEVSFNGAIATPFARTLTQLAIIVPAGATTGPLTVKDLNTNQTYSVAGGFTVNGSTTTPIGQTTTFVAIPSNGAFTGAANNVEIDFIDLVGANISIDNTNITLQMTVRNLPSTLTFNQAAIPALYLEYEWAVDFDVNNDGAADYTISMSEFNLGGKQPTTKSILSGTQVNVSKHQEFAAYSIAIPQASINGNTITLSIPKSANTELARITSNAKVMIRSFYKSSATTSVTDSL